MKLSKREQKLFDPVRVRRTVRLLDAFEKVHRRPHANTEELRQFVQARPKLAAEYLDKKGELHL